MSNEDLHDLYLNTLHELNHEKLRREGFEKDVEMHKKMTNLLADRAAGVIVERDRLKAEVTDLKSTADRLKAEVERLTALVESNLNSSKVAMGKADAVLHERDSLKAEVERLTSTIGAQGVELDDLRARLRT